MKLALGPILYYWPREAVEDFYRLAAVLPVEIVYLGETVCTRRHELRMADWLRIAGELAQAGKEVVLSSPALIESESDLKVMRRAAENGTFRVECNEWGAVRVAAGRAGFVAGPHLNVYNAETMALLHSLGAARWVMPPELSGAALASLQAGRPHGMQTEVFAFGRIPLAFSARCFTARHFDLSKDACEFRCIEHPDGLALGTREGEPFLTLNGIQTQSAGVYNLAREIPCMRELGVDVLRLSPQSRHMERVVGAFRGCLSGADAVDVETEMREWLPGRPCDGYWHGRPGMDWSHARA